MRARETPWLLREVKLDVLSLPLLSTVLRRLRRLAYMAMYNFYSHQGCSPRKCRRRRGSFCAAAPLYHRRLRKYCNIKLYTNIIYKQQKIHIRIVGESAIGRELHWCACDILAGTFVGVFRAKALWLR